MLQGEVSFLRRTDLTVRYNRENVARQASARRSTLCGVPAMRSEPRPSDGPSSATMYGAFDSSESLYSVSKSPSAVSTGTPISAPMT